MRIPTLISAALLLGMGFTSCTDHKGATDLTTGANPPPPVTQPESPIIQPSTGGEPGTGSTSTSTSGGGNGGTTGGTSQPGGGTPVPEPTTMLLVGTGLAGAALYRRRRNPKVTAES